MKDVKGFEGRYAVTENGRVWSYERQVPLPHGGIWKCGGRFLKQIIDNWGYPKVHLSKDGDSRKIFVHLLVAQAFIPNLRNLPQVNHKNGIKIDNRVGNLEWCTCKENINHAIQTGLRKSRTYAA